MKNLIKCFGIVALVAVIGFTMTACGGGGGSDNSGATDPTTLIGKWYATQADANSGEEEYKIPLEFTSDGKIKKYGADRSFYTVDGNTITFNDEEVHNFSISGTVLTTTSGNGDIIKDDPNKFYKPRQ